MTVGTVNTDVGRSAHRRWGGISEAGVDPIHQPLILHRALETHFRFAALLDRRSEVAIHRPIPADVADARHDHARPGPAANHDEGAVRFEGDDTVAAEQLRKRAARGGARAPRASSTARRPPNCRTGTRPSGSSAGGRARDPKARADTPARGRSADRGCPPGAASESLPRRTRRRQPWSDRCASRRLSSAASRWSRSARRPCRRWHPRATSVRSVTASGL